MADDKTRILTADDAQRLAALAEPADDRTRVLSAEEAARILATPRADGRGAAPKKDVAAGAPTPHEPRLVGDKIVFLCANGHRLSVDRALAGKKGNCSKQGCGVPVEIPIPPGLEPPSPPPRSPAPRAAAEAAPVDAGAVEPAPPPFPVVTDVPAEPAGEAPAAGPADAPWDFMASQAAAPAADLGIEPPEAATWSVDPAEIDNPTARLVARLWLERAHGGVVEIHLSGGSVIMPEWYDARWSCGTHALFAALGPDETVTLTAVAWDQIQKVVVRQVQGTPDGMFEG